MLSKTLHLTKKPTNRVFCKKNIHNLWIFKCIKVLLFVQEMKKNNSKCSFVLLNIPKNHILAKKSGFTKNCIKSHKIVKNEEKVKKLPEMRKNGQIRQKWRKCRKTSKNDQKVSNMTKMNTTYYPQHVLKRYIVYSIFFRFWENSRGQFIAGWYQPYWIFWKRKFLILETTLRLKKC